MRTAQSRTVACALALMLLLTGCTTGQKPGPATPREYAFPTDKVGDVTSTWTAADGIDLHSPEATIVRATEEALSIAGFVGEEGSFPGLHEFWNDYLDSQQSVDLRTTLEGRDKQRRVTGTRDYHIYKLDWAGDELIAEYCIDDSYEAGSYDAGATFDWPRVSITRVFSRKVTLARDTTEPPAPVRAPSGLRAPTWNAFDGWQAIDLFRGGDFDYCSTWYNTRDRDPDRPYWPQYSSQDPEYRPPPGPNPPIAPPTPGW
ncbi:hypothetical protein [Lolliginicoccus suaedae]|uniref:hypothetical protein n=1 Tax=Lolliginicoccus suaedae TaxID=2605429 RepID=UPI0011EE63B6|nr:hypothetical protein [Lolliginicoccus suaedae]